MRRRIDNYKFTLDYDNALEPNCVYGSISGVSTTPPPYYILSTSVNTKTFAISQTPPVDYILNDPSLEFH